MVETPTQSAIAESQHALQTNLSAIPPLVVAQSLKRILPHWIPDFRSLIAAKGVLANLNGVWEIVWRTLVATVQRSRRAAKKIPLARKIWFPRYNARARVGPCVKVTITATAALAFAQEDRSAREGTESLRQMKNAGVVYQQ